MPYGSNNSSHNSNPPPYRAQALCSEGLSPPGIPPKYAKPGFFDIQYPLHPWPISAVPCLTASKTS